MFDGTLASKGPWQALVTFQQMIVLANPDGIVDMTASAISRRTSIPLEIIEVGIAKLMEPDPESRTPDEDGRRISLLDDHRNWGWQIVNHAKYQAMRNAAERRDYLKDAQAKRRARLKEEAQNAGCQHLSTPVNSCSAGVHMSTPTDTDASTDADATTEKSRERARASRLPADWELPEEWRDWAKTHRPDLIVDEIAAKFADYWHSKPGKAGTKLDWFATWRNWVREEKAPRTNGHSGTGETAYQRSVRERVEEMAPSVARKAPGAIKPETIDAAARFLD